MWQGRLAFAMCAITVVWAATLFVVATPLVSDNRPEAAIVFPTMTALAVSVLLHRHCTPGSMVGLALALAVVAAFFPFAFLAILSIGIFVLPLAPMLAGAIGLTPPAARRPPAR